MSGKRIIVKASKALFGAALFLCSTLFIQPANVHAIECGDDSGDSTTISARYYHTVGLKEDGTVVAVGRHQYGQTDVSTWAGIKAVSAGFYHTVGLKEDGTVVAVGDNRYGQTYVSNWTGVKAVSAGEYHTVGLKEDDTVVAGGQNKYGQTDVWGWRLPCGGAPSTPEEVSEAIEDMLSGDEITSSGIANAIISSLHNAQRKIATRPVSARNMLKALIKKIEAQAGKKISEESAAKLIGYLENIIDEI